MRNFVVVLLALILFVAVPPTYAEDVQSTATEEVPGWEVIEAAREFSAGYKGVAVVIFQGKDVSYSADQLGRGFVKAFKDRNTAAQYFSDDLGDEVTSVIFFLDRGDAIGPFNVTDALKKVPEMAEKHRIANLHPY